MARHRYVGRHEQTGAHRRVSIRKKSLLLLVSLILIFALAVGGTLAYVAVKSAQAENQFEAASVTCQVQVSGDTVSVKNTGNIQAYIRAAVTVNWMDSSGHVRGLAPVMTDYTLGYNTADWWQDTATGYWYYRNAVAAGAETNALVTSVVLQTAAPEGYALSVEVTAEAIQAPGDTDADGTPAYQDAWGIASISG